MFKKKEFNVSDFNLIWNKSRKELVALIVYLTIM